MKLTQLLVGGLTALSLVGSTTALTNEVNQLFEKLDIANQKVFDKGEQLRDDIFDNWSHSQIDEWLKSHKLKSSSSYDEAKAMAIKNKDLLIGDIKGWLDEAGQVASPFLAKSKDQIYSTKDAIFEQTAKTWSDLRLREFLEARGITGYTDATRDQLLDAVNKYKKLAVNNNFFGTWSFDALSSDDIKQWFAKQGNKIEGTRQNLVSSAQDYLQQVKDNGIDAVESTKDMWNRNKKAAFDTWSDSDLKDFLTSFGEKVDSVTDRNQLLEKAQHNYNYFVYGPEKSYTQLITDQLGNLYNKANDYLGCYGSGLYKKLTAAFANRGDL